MATTIRLQRHGKKGKPFFHLIAADSRSPRDGKFIEKIGTYNPTSNPAMIDIDFDRCLHWVKTGAKTSDTARAILAYKGVLYKSHLDRGVIKGALTQEQADTKFERWAKEKTSKIDGKKERLTKQAEENDRNRMKHEAEVNQNKAAKIAAKNVEAPAAENTEAEQSAE